MSESSEKTDNTKRGDKRGILRLDINKPRNSSGSVEFRNQPELISEASSPQSTQLSVKWAFPQDNTSRAENASDVQVRSSEKRAKKSLSADYFGFQPYYDQFYMEPIDVPEYINSEDEDYSLSLSAVIQRRASVRGRKKGYYSPRRASSPMGHVSGVCGIPAGNSIAVSKADRRRSSVYTTSSGETVVSLGDGANNQESTKEQIFENIRLHKEVLQSVKMQPWSMRRKLRLVRQAREYIARHEGALQERFAMSRSTKDLWARFKIVLTVKWQHFRRELVNLSTLFVPWQLRIKEIESHFGSVVASYFTFLRWLFWVNIVLAFTLSTFVILPEFIASQYDDQKDHRKNMLAEEFKNATRLTTFLNFQGYLKYSPLFYGYYSDYSGIAKQGYNLPLAYFFAGVAVYIYSFWATLRKMADNSRMSKMSSKEDECIFSWKLFTGWDYMIGHAETAHNRVASVVLGFKEALLEEAEKKKDTQNWEIILRRIFVNIMVLCLLVLSATAVVIVVERSSVQTKATSYWRQNETSFVMTGISFFFPTCFEILGLLEKYHPRKQLRWQLGRIMLLNLLNLFSLIIALFKKIYSMNDELDDLRHCKGMEDSLNSTNLLNDTITGNGTIDLKFHSDVIFSDGMMSTTTPSYAEATAVYGILHAAINDLFPNIIPNVAKIATAFSKNAQNATKKCITVPVNCSNPKNTTKSVLTSLLALNFATTILPEINSQLNGMDSTTVTAYTDFDIFSSTSTSSATGSTYFDELSTNYTDNDTMIDDPNSTYSIDSSTTILPFNGVMETDYEATTPYYEYDYGDETDSQRYRRDIIKAPYKTANDEIENEPFSYYDDINDNSNDTDSFYDTTIYDADNITELIASTVSSFLDSTITIDPTNETSISEQWENYLSTIGTTETDTYDSTATDIDIDTTVADGCVDGYKIICLDDVDDNDDGGGGGVGGGTVDLTTPMTTNQSPMEMRAPDTALTIARKTTPTIFWNGLPTTITMSDQNYTLNSNTTNSTCIPFAPNRGDDITGVPPEYAGRNLTKTIEGMSTESQQKLRDLCWETLFGQELVKLTVLDLIFTIFATIFMDFFRALFVRFMNKCWCWDLEKKFPKYGDFKIAENILHLVNNQGQVWMGMFFAPGLAILNLVKLGILMYFRSWAVLTCNVPHEVIFRASRSNNFYLALLLTMLFLCVLPVSYAIVWIEPSWHCGPFAHHARIHRVFTDTLRSNLPGNWHRPMDIIASPSTVIPLLLLLILIIYYLLSLTGALREANQDLKNQLRRERQEERRKMLQRVVNAKLDDSGGGNNAIDRWRKVLEASSPVTPNAPGQPVEPDEEKMKARREFLARIMKKALRKSSNTSEDESHVGDDGDETDTEQHEQLPHDQDTNTDKRTPIKRKRSGIQLVDERIEEQPAAQQFHAEQQQQQQKPHHNHRHHHQRNHHPHPRTQQPQPRKLSFMQLRDIVETSHQKSDANETKPIKSISAIVEPKGKEKEKRIKSDENAKIHEDDYNKVNVVTERRALRRQQNARESEGSLSLQMPDSSNFDIVHEKPKPIEKPPRTKSPLKSPSPEIFQFESDVGSGGVAREFSSSRENYESDMDQSSLKDTVCERTAVAAAAVEAAAAKAAPKAKSLSQKESSSSQSKGASPTTSIQLHSPKALGAAATVGISSDSGASVAIVVPMAVNSSAASTPHGSQEKNDSLPSQSPLPSPSPSSSEKLAKHSDDILNKPIRKLNSFLALVKEAMHAKKQEQQKNRQQAEEAQQQQQDIQFDASPSHIDLMSRVKLFIDDSNSVSMSESTKTTTESMTSSKNTTYFESIRRLRHHQHHHTEPPKPKRQDSQASIWSENIPVITISKSESDECILERDNDDIECSDNKSAVK